MASESLIEIALPDDLEYSSDGNPVPIEFYLEALPVSKIIYLKLGYFSSKAIQVLSYGFAQFIHNGGRIHIITNHFLYKADRELLNEKRLTQTANLDSKLLEDLSWLKEQLDSESIHFFNCLKLLVRLKRLEIIPVMLKPGRMAHYKQGVFIDGDGNMLFMDGSCNFTANGLIENAENISVYRSWGSELEKKKVDSKKRNIESILKRDSDKYEYLDSTQIIDAITSIGRDKGINELLREELEILQRLEYENISAIIDKYRKNLEEKIEWIQRSPRFPFIEGPREYQRVAYENWVDAGKQGIFAMATGTGKTITALNCLLNEYQLEKTYQTIILVPSLPLLEQWYSETRNFNFLHIYRASSKHQWKNEIDSLNTGLAFNSASPFVVITTYQTFSDEGFQKRISNFPESTLLIADEAHNIGSNRMKAILPELKFRKRIALSATPRRRFDEEGNALIEEYFNSSEPYTYSFSMGRAIKEEILCPYYYYPHKVYLNSEEMEKYSGISKKLVKLFDSSNGTFRNPELAKMLLLERRRIIHKAKGKINAFSQLMNEIVKQRGGLNFSFVYVPEGDSEEGENLLDLYMETLEENCPSVKAHHYTSQSQNRAEVMKHFEEGYIDCLFSMKCLDEGVDIPRAEIAIFCSSTGNPRQFIQRRGRILRRHAEKEFATIHDLVVLPQADEKKESFSLERNLIREELIRVIYFASLSRNYYDAMNEFQEVANYYDLNMFSLEEELRGDLDG